MIQKKTQLQTIVHCINATKLPLELRNPISQIQKNKLEIQSPGLRNDLISVSVS